MGKKILKVVLLIIVLLIVILIVHTIRNYVIVTDLQDKILQYQESTNYHIKSVANADNGGTITTMDYYKKDNKQVVFMERNFNGEILKLSMYDNGERVDTFIETQDEKVAQLDRGDLMSVNIYNYLETDNTWQTILGCITARIKSTNYNGKECYSIKGFMSPLFLSTEGAETYIDKETGLFVKTTEAEIVNEREYEFNNVDDSVFAEPDLSKYTLKENK